MKKLPVSLLVLSLSAWGCGEADVAASPASVEQTEQELQARAFNPREVILLSFSGDTHSAALMITDTPGACARFQQGKRARWEKVLTFELGKADGYTEDPMEANALPLDKGFYKVVHHDDTSAGPFQDRWSIVFNTERDGECNNTSTLGSAQGGGVYLQSLDLSSTGGGRGAYHVSFGSGAAQRFGVFEATPCVINIEDLPPVFTCE
ncbi:hypothetical protein HPC49_08835 [Pyxidicoccus fallax]|uniref:Lipoprotein n=1 Tax=Pyxidicoccus fallax TaxID=394095 RepID=A0A848LCE1_9BACT|nr:hypothetical protein [Pyxidicoccus fallax]NMO13951.1 hypothetical protein [Pyxidicoccus fallax]NPC78350.1 hypothetical protein [Pyxidicoccus fallax]